MERITAINENGRAYYPECFEKCDGIGFSAKCDHCKVAEAACERLAAYENTGITPEQICDLDRMYRELATEYGKYKKQEEQGLLLKLPCKAGDAVWYINERIEKQGRKKVTVFFVDDGSVDNITLGGVMIPQIEVCNNKENSWITFDYKEDWNKTVFLTRTEAEEALQKKMGK